MLTLIFTIMAPTALADRGVVASLPTMLNLSAPSRQQQVDVFEELLLNVRRYCCSRIVVHHNAVSPTPSSAVSTLVTHFPGVVINPQRLEVWARRLVSGRGHGLSAASSSRVRARGGEQPSCSAIVRE